MWFINCLKDKICKIRSFESNINFLVVNILKINFVIYLAEGIGGENYESLDRDLSIPKLFIKEKTIFLIRR